MVTENEDKLSTKNETENLKPALSKITDADIQKSLIVLLKIFRGRLLIRTMKARINTK